MLLTMNICNQDLFIKVDTLNKGKHFKTVCMFSEFTILIYAAFEFKGKTCTVHLLLVLYSQVEPDVVCVYRWCR